MKQRNLILTMLLMAFLAQNVKADQTENKNASANEAVTDAQENANLEKIHALLKLLAKTKALELDENGNIQIKKTIVEKLRDQGRISDQPASASSLCD